METTIERKPSPENVNDELYYYRARYLRPDLGRFVAMDDLGYAVSSNHYYYVLNNPLEYIDPKGLSPLPPQNPECCYKSALQRRIDMIEDKLKKGYFDAMGFGGSTSNRLVDLGNGWYRMEPMDEFRPNCAFSDPCIKHCCELHEWYHYTDDTQFRLEWSQEKLDLELEKPAYEIELKCLKRFI